VTCGGARNLPTLSLTENSQHQRPEISGAAVKLMLFEARAGGRLK